MNELRQLLRPAYEHRRVLLVAAVLLFCTFAYFVPAPGWNQNSRLSLTRALVERGAVDIDPDHETTGDKSFAHGHFYSDKAPGVSLLATVPYAALYATRRLLGQELPQARVLPLDPLDRLTNREIAPSERLPGDILVYNGAHRLALYFCTLATVGLWSIAAALAVYLLVLARATQGDNPQHVGHRRALACALVYALGTPALTYSTTLYGHQLCAAFAIVAFAVVVLTPAQSRSAIAGTLAGAFLGLATLTEYPAAAVAVAIGVLALWRHGWRFAAYLVVGGIPFALALGLYHFMAFGSPLQTGYDFVYLPEFAEGMRVNYGIGRPDPRALLEITFGGYRGLFTLSPILLLAVWGLVRSFIVRDAWCRAAVATAIAIVSYFLLLNAGYYMWDGGASAGPRHLIPMLPFLALGLDAAWRAAPWACKALAAVSVAQVVLLTAAGAEAAQWGHLIAEFAIPEALGLSERSMTTNVGRLLGLPAGLSLLPLGLLWAFLWNRLWREPVAAG